MSTVTNIEPTHAALLEAITTSGFGVTRNDDVLVERLDRVDSRNGWDTHVVLVAGIGVYGFTDGPLIDGM